MLSRRRLLRGLVTAALWPRRLWAQPLPPSNLQVGKMAIAFVQSASRDTGASPLALAFGSNNTAGNFIVVAIRLGSATIVPTVADSQGNTYTEDRRQVQTTDGHRTFIFSAPNIAAGANTVTVTFSGGVTCRFAIHEYSGLATSSVLDQVNSAEDDTNTAWSSGDVTTTQADELLFGFASGQNSQARLVTKGAAYTLREYITVDLAFRIISEDRIVAATGTYNANWTINNGTETKTALIATYKAPAAAAAGAPPGHGALLGDVRNAVLQHV